MLAWLHRESGGRTLRANRELVVGNARLAGEVAAARMSDVAPSRPLTETGAGAVSRGRGEAAESCAGSCTELGDSCARVARPSRSSR